MIIKNKKSLLRRMYNVVSKQDISGIQNEGLIKEKKIVLWKGVKYYGKVASKVASFEIFFNKLCLVVKETELGTIIFLRKKNTDSYEKVWLKVDDKKIFSFDVRFKLYVVCDDSINDPSFFYIDEYDYRMKKTGVIYRIRDVCRIRTMLMFIYEEAFVVLYAEADIMDSLLKKDEAIENIINKSGFNFSYEGNTVSKRGSRKKKG